MSFENPAYKTKKLKVEGKYHVEFLRGIWKINYKIHIICLVLVTSNTLTSITLIYDSNLKQT